MMVDVDDAGACAWAALEIALVGLTADLRRHRRDHVVSLGVVGATERVSAILETLRTRATGSGVRCGGPAGRLASARAAVALLVDDADALGLSARLLLLLARAAHALSEAERVLVPGSWESS
ncbi:MAG: hypothetical protein U0R27_00715 [Candidatus Nanopelagicales bacterium]